jgi:hypothetical protein
MQIKGFSNSSSKLKKKLPAKQEKEKIVFLMKQTVYDPSTQVTTAASSASGHNYRTYPRKALFSIYKLISFKLHNKFKT